MFERVDDGGLGCVVVITLVVIALMVAGYFIIDAILPDKPCEEHPTESINADLAKIYGYDYLYYSELVEVIPTVQVKYTAN